MDIGANQIVSQIASSTSQYLGEYLPVIVLVAGIALAFGVMDYVLGVFRGEDFPTVGAQPGYAPTNQMVADPRLNIADRNYYRSRYYPGSDKFVGFESDEYKRYTKVDDD